MVVYHINVMNCSINKQQSNIALSVILSYLARAHERTQNVRVEALVQDHKRRMQTYP